MGIEKFDSEKWFENGEKESIKKNTEQWFNAADAQQEGDVADTFSYTKTAGELHAQAGDLPEADENSVVRIHPEYKPEVTLVPEVLKTPEIESELEMEMASLKSQMAAAQENLDRMKAQMAQLEARLKVEKAA